VKSGPQAPLRINPKGGESMVGNDVPSWIDLFSQSSLQIGSLPIWESWPVPALSKK